MDKCFICEEQINLEKDIFYPQMVVENRKIIPVKLCEECMTDIHKCPQCGLAQAYCNECV